MANANKEKESILQEDVISSANEIKLVVMDAEKTTEYPEVPVLDGNARAQAFRIADKIQDEAHKLWFLRRTKTIRNGILELNRQNTYSFIGYMITTSNSQSALGDIGKFMTYEVLKHMLMCLLKQAEDYGLGDSFQYKKLKNEYYKVLNEGCNSLKKKVSGKLIKETNMYVENLFLEMTKVLH